MMTRVADNETHLNNTPLLVIVFEKELIAVLSKILAYTPSMVGSQPCSNLDCMNWMVRADLPTPPPPTTINLFGTVSLTVLIDKIICS